MSSRVEEHFGRLHSPAFLSVSSDPCGSILTRQEPRVCNITRLIRHTSTHSLPSFASISDVWAPRPHPAPGRVSACRQDPLLLLSSLSRAGCHLELHPLPCKCPSSFHNCPQLPGSNSLPVSRTRQVHDTSCRRHEVPGHGLSFFLIQRLHLTEPVWSVARPRQIGLPPHQNLVLIASPSLERP